MAVSGTVPARERREVDALVAARWLRRGTVVLAVVAFTWFLLKFGTAWVPANMDTVPGVPPGAWCIVDRWAGGLRVGRSRVLLELVIRAFQDGATPEAIVQRYPTTTLADIYAVVAYYLRHREGDLFLTASIRAAVQAIYDHPLTTEAVDKLNRQLRTGIGDEALAEMVTNLHRDDRLAVVNLHDAELQEPRILCSLGLRQYPPETAAPAPTTLI